MCLLGHPGAAQTMLCPSLKIVLAVSFWGSLNFWWIFDLDAIVPVVGFWVDAGPSSQSPDPPPPTNIGWPLEEGSPTKNLFSQWGSSQPGRTNPLGPLWCCCCGVP